MSILLLVAPGQNVIYAHVIIQNFESKTLFCTQIGFSSLLGAFNFVESKTQMPALKSWA